MSFLSRSVLFAALFSVAFAAPLAPRKDLTRIANGKTTGRYIVGLKSRKSRADILNSPAVNEVITEWKNINAFTIAANDATLDTLLSHEDVKYVEEEGFVGLDAALVQGNATWGLSRLSAKGTLGATDMNALTYNYTYDNSGGKGVDAYVIDTGVRLTHEQFGGRASWGASFPSSYAETDVYGHGTHVAGTIAASQLGVAKSANIIAVRVLDDSGTGPASDCLSGMDWVLSAHQASGRSSIASISLHYDPSSAFDEAVTALTNAGVHVVVSAGNSNENASGQSPARSPDAVTVGATDIFDAKATYSNWGPLVDIFAPGTNIISTYSSSDTATAVMSGTSMSTPHISGLIAYLITLEGDLPPANMSQKLKDMSEKGLISGMDTTTINAIAHNGS